MMSTKNILKVKLVYCIRERVKESWNEYMEKMINEENE